MKRVMTIVMSLVLAVMMVMPVSAEEMTYDISETEINESVTASNYFTGQTGTMNSLYGNESVRYPITSPTISTGNPLVTKVTVTVTKKSSSANFYLYVKSPSGNIESILVTSSGTYYFYTEFDNEDPEGTWYVWIESVSGIATASARLRVDYIY
ncbi:hypothetical protein SAMN04487884_10996 [Butyrivibrio fibrisolvens]|uniref:Uncharacterized protein n=1 Tax=Butyrivibrio fibrisolvens TaxID=831 RepID=A0A1H9RAN6_BUTFI|nr:hypothetical protein [Butyrivibrio fibrisolvens]SER69687.1 hypothetical protein SAMN04487884_10996 [Butyrivibrio fibrisolvens]